MAESPLAAFLRTLGVTMPTSMAQVAPASPGPRIGPNPHPMAAKVQEALGLPGYAPNLPEGSYGLPPSIGAPSAGQGLQDDLLAAIDALVQSPPSTGNQCRSAEPPDVVQQRH